MNKLASFADMVLRSFGFRRAPKPKQFHPSSGYQLDGYKYVGRGCGGKGWGQGDKLYYRCAECGDLMPASFDDYHHCNCKAMSVDVDAGRFGSRNGDDNILRYEKLAPGEIDSLTTLRPGTTIEVIREFRDFDGHVWPVGYQFVDLKQYNCVPYHGGHTIQFDNAVLRLCDNEPDNNAVLFKSGEFFREITQ